MPRNGNRLMAFDRMNLTLHRVDIGNGGKIKIFPPNKRFKVGDKFFTDRYITRNRSRFDIGCALPILANGLIIGIGRLNRHRRGR